MENATPHQYLRIANAMRAKIGRGDWQPHMMLPGRRALAQTFGVAVNTVERAVTLLVTEGLLQADDRRGTFVADRADVGDRPSSLQPAPIRERTRPATVGILATLWPQADATSEAQWAHHLLRGCEQTLAESAEVTHRFVNRVLPGSPQIRTMDAAVDVLLAEPVDGIILLNEAELPPLLARVDPARIPLIVVNMTPLGLTVHEVTADDVAAGYLAVQHLLLRGYRRITTFFPFSGDWARARLAGIAEALRRTQAPEAVVTEFALSTLLDPTHENQTAVGYTHAPALLATVAPGEAIIAANDAVAGGILLAAREVGRLPGADFGLLSFDDYPAAREQGLTSLHPPLEAMGREAARLMARALQGDVIPLHVSLAAYVMARTSTLRG
jgi:DNA-binding LacI/PurR family transcriptional regulator/DNA-binding transcriptional regulator YhcF (GntR family)